MISKKIALIISIIFLVSSSCQNISKDSTVSNLIDNVGNTLTVCHYHEIKDTICLNLSDLVEDFKIIRFENRDSAIFKSSSLPTFTEHYIGISQSGDSFLLFNSEGKFINKVGKIGQGPGEYPMVIYDAIIDEKEKEIYLASFAFLNKILIYNLKGDFIREQVTENRLNKPKIRLNENNRLVILHLPMEQDNKKILAFQYDKNGQKEKMHDAYPSLWVKDFSQDLFAFHNVPEFSFYNTSCDTLFHYLPETNEIRPKLTMDFGNLEKNPVHIYNELPDYYIIIIFGKGIVFVNKKTQKASYVKIINDFLGHMSITFNFKNGWAYRMYEPAYLIEYIEKRLKENDCTEKDREQLTRLLESIHEDDNNILFLGKLK